jgi:hypothetical protein
MHRGETDFNNFSDWGSQKFDEAYVGESALPTLEEVA